MYKTIEDVRKAVLSGTSVLEITKYYLSKIKEQSNLNVFVEVFEQEVLQQASFVDNKIKSKSAGKLAGVVVAIKDNICYMAKRFVCDFLIGGEVAISATLITANVPFSLCFGF